MTQPNNTDDYTTSFPKYDEQAPQSPYVPQDSYTENDPYAQAETPVQEGSSSQEDARTSASEQQSFNPYSQSASSAPQWNDPAAGAYSQSPIAPSSSLSVNIKSILGLVFAFVFFPVGLILSWLGWNEAKENNDESGRILGLVGLIISLVQVGIVVLSVLLFIFIAFLSAASGM